MQPLPAPSSGLFLEVSFRRLLKSCIEITEGDSKGRADLASWQTSPVFHHVTIHRFSIRFAAHADARDALLKMTVCCLSIQYVETLQEQLSDLKSQAHNR